ncbi:MAG TPA: porin family protein [Candidatus Polarisedimenticolia bacterium]|nr:porin family protein [Candidatus Polarisedimenticolia bacterium]
MKKLLSLGILGLFVFVVPASAGIGAGQGEVGVDYGNTSYDSDTGLESSDSLSLRGGYFFTNLFQIEGQYISSDSNSEELGSAVQASTDIMMVNGVFNFMPGKEVKPYVLVGLGQANVDVDVQGVGSQDDSGTAYQIGAGSRFFFGKSKRTAFRFDVSMINADTFDEKQTNTMVAGGFTFRLGR